MNKSDRMNPMKTSNKNQYKTHKTVLDKNRADKTGTDKSSTDKDTRKPGTGTLALEALHLSKIVSSPEGMLTILDDLSMQVAHGERLAIVGASGAGKSTLLGILAGLDLPTSGQVLLGGHELTALDEDGRAALRADKVGFVFQSFHLIPSLTALENVMLPLELTHHENPREGARAALESVGLGRRAGHYPRQLSGGEKQRVAIARAYVTQPTVLFADEPTGNLDQQSGEAVIDILFQMNREQGTTLILVSHDLNLAGRCDRIIEMAAGRIVGSSADTAGRETTV